MSDKKIIKYLVVRGTGGIGNRIENTLTCILYAKLSNRVLFIDWSDPVFSEDGTNVFNRLFTLKNVAHVNELPQTVSDNLPATPVFFTNKVFTRTDLKDDILQVRGPIHQINILREHFKGEFAGFKGKTDHEIMRELLTDNLILNENVKLKVDAFKNEHFKGKMLGVHIRYTDAKRPLPSYHKGTEEMLRRHPDANIFLCTDNEKLVHEYRNKYGDVLVREKWFPDKEGATLYRNSDCPDRLQGCIDALIDLWLLSECDSLVYTGCSTFPAASLALANLPEENKFDIEKIPYFISVIIPLYDFSDLGLLKKCLKGLETQTYQRKLFEVIIAHNGINSEIDNYLISRDIMTVSSKESAGRYALRNKGILCGKGEMFAFLSPECVPDNDWIEQGVTTLRKHQSVVFAVGKIDNPIVGCAEKRTLIEVYQDIFFKLYRLIHKGDKGRPFMRRYWYEHKDNMFIYAYGFEDYGLYDPDVQHTGDLLWWENYKNERCFYFVYAENIRVTSPGRIRTFAELFNVIYLFANEYYSHKKIHHYPVRSFKEDIHSDLRTMKTIFVEKTADGIGNKLGPMLVLSAFSFFRVFCRIFLIIKYHFKNLLRYDNSGYKDV